MSLKRRMQRVAEKGVDRGDVVHFNAYEIAYSPMHADWHARLPPAGRTAIRRIHTALHQPELDHAIVEELEQLVLAYPFAPVFYNYLTIAYSRQHRFDLSEQVAQAMLQRFPDYLFGRMNRAELLLADGDLAGVRELLGDTLQLRALYPRRTRFHVSEFAAYYGMVARYHLHAGNRATAALILDLLHEVAPHEIVTRHLASQLEQPRLLRGLARLRRMLRRVIFRRQSESPSPPPDPIAR